MKKKYVIILCFAFVLVSFGLSSDVLEKQHKTNYNVCEYPMIPGYNPNIYSQEAGIFYEEIKLNVINNCG